ncbi:MAG TPA: HD domain-containing protein [Dehalococcoidia bacterium]|nr:HD domain-containing protein [Dehalococcoidia bacterium]
MSSADGPLSRALYRVRQFLSSLRPRLGREEVAEAGAVLGPSLFPLFMAMSPRDRRHCLDVYRRLRQAGCQDRELLMAALLHDVGKGQRVRLWHRVAYVLLSATAPGLLSRAGGGLAVLRDHGQLGAAMLARAGAPPAVVDLVRRHEEAAEGEERLALLQQADDSC